MDGRRFVMACDEFRAYLLNDQFAAVIDKFLLTVRKNNGMLILGTQQPEHVLELPRIGDSLVAQCQKILFPSPTADRKAYIEGLKCTEGEFRAVREDMLTGRRRFLLKREGGIGDLRLRSFARAGIHRGSQWSGQYGSVRGPAA